MSTDTNTNTTSCDHCGSSPAVPHSFRYGRQTVDLDPERSVWASHYEVAGVDTVALCAHCLARARTRRTFRLLLHEWFGVPVVTVAYVLWAVALAVLVWQGDGSTTAWLLAGGLVVTTLVYTAIYLVLQSEDFAQHAAMLEHEQYLRDQGWDTFWTDKEFGTLAAPH
jgi:uncharacterized membrane protein (DUF485 family)